MRRRDFIKGIVISATAWPPLVAQAQQSGKLRTIGFLGASSSIESQRVAAPSHFRFWGKADIGLL